MRSLCQAADDKLIAFVDTLQLECLEMYKDNSDGNNEKSDTVELPQVSVIPYYKYYYLYLCYLLLLNVYYVKAIGQLLCCIPSVVGTATSRKIRNIFCC